MAPGPRVNHFSESMFTGGGHGVHTAVLELADAQSRLGARVGINRSWPDGILHVHTAGPISRVRLRLHRGLRVISAHVTPDSLLGSISGAEVLRRQAERYLRSFYESGDIVIAVSQSAAREVRGLGVTSPIEVVPNGIDPDPFVSREVDRATSRRMLGMSEERFVVLAAGQLQPRKRPDVFLECARLRPDIQFVWLGAPLFGPLSKDRRNLLRAMRNAPPNIWYVGQVPRGRLVRYMRAADLFFHPADHETFGLAVIEAAFAGLPLVLRDLPVYREVLGSSNPSYIGASNIEQFVKAIDMLRSDERQRTRLARSAREVASNYNALRVAKIMLSCYDAVGINLEHRSTLWHH